MVFSAFFRQTTRILAGLLLLTATAFGQTTTRKPDLIVKRDNTAIEAVINEIEEAAITYRRFSAPTGQLYRIDKAKLKYIRYANGDVEKFDEPALAGKSTSPKPTQPSGAGRTSAPASTQSSSSGTQRPTATGTNSQASSGSGSGRSSSSPQSGAAKPQSSGSQRPPVSSTRISKPQAPPAEKVANDVAGSAASAGIKIGVLVGAGLSQSQSKVTVAGQTISGSSELIPEALSFRGGVTAEIPLGPVAIAPALEYMMEKFAAKVPAIGTISAQTSSVTYNHVVLTVPVILADNPDKKMGLYVGLGPFVSYAISGKSTYSGKSTDIVFDKDGGTKRIQAGVNARLGVRFSALSVFALGTYTLTNTIQVPSGADAKGSSLFAGLQLQYKFGN
jgi:hypothetical protein